MSCLVIGRRPGAGLDQVRLEEGEGAHQGVALGVAEALPGLGPGPFADLAQQREAGVGVGREVEQPAAPVRGVLAALDEPARLELVEDPHQRDGLDLRISASAA